MSKRRANEGALVYDLGKEGQRTLSAIAAVIVCLFALSVDPAAGAPKSLNGFVGDRPVVDTGGLFSQPRDVVVYTAGTPSRADDKILVVEASTGPNHRVHRLDGDGNFERLWGRNVIRPGFPGNTGDGFEVCTAALSGAAGCQGGDDSGDAGGELDDPTGVAVNQSTGHVYVIDRDNQRVQEFTLDGAFVRAWGWGVATGANALEVCATAGSCLTGLAGSGAGQLGSTDQISSIAVSPVDGDVFVTDSGNGRLLRFESDGTFVEAVGSASEFAASWPQHVAIDANGVVYASDSASGNRIVRFDTDPTALLEPLAAPDVALLPAIRTAGLEIDASTGNLLVGRDSSAGGEVVTTVQEIADSGASVSGGPPTPTVVESHVFSEAADDLTGGATRNLGIDPVTGNIYLASPGLFNPLQPGGIFTGCQITVSSSCSGLVVLAQSIGPLQVALSAPGEVGTTTAQLVGSIDLAGGVVRYQFQVSTDGTNWVDASGRRYLAGAGSTPVSVQATGLEPATAYRVRLLVTRQTDFSVTESVTSNEGIIVTDTAPPIVTTLGSSNRTDSSVRLRGLVDPSGTHTAYRFEYGPAGGSFDVHVPIPDAVGGSGNAPLLRVQDVDGLQSETAYHYRIVATNSTGTAVGKAVTFVTRAASPPPTPPVGRGYELVSPAEKLAGVGVGVWYHGPAAAGTVGFPAYEGERFAVRGVYGAVLLDGEFSFANDWALAQRTPNGWVNESAASRKAHGSQTLTFFDMVGATDDLSLLSFDNVGLKLFPEQEDWVREEAGSILYLRDWESGKWETFGPTDPAQGGNLGSWLRIADDSRSAVTAATTRGLAGPGDPTLDLPPNVSNVLLDEFAPGGPSDTFPGLGTRSVVNVCTQGTEIPDVVDVVGGEPEQGAQPCPPAAPSRDAALIAGARGAALGPQRRGAISPDGSRVFFMSPNPLVGAGGCSGTGASTVCPAQLYVRQRNSMGFVTRWISRSEVAGQEASLMGPVLFEGASRDGDKVFFRTAAPLTEDDPNGEGQAPPAGGVVTGTPSDESWDLYMYDMPDGHDADPAGGDLTRITAGPQEDGDCNSPLSGSSLDLGAMRYLSEDGSRLYFSCAAPLEGVPPADDGTITLPGGTPSTTAAVNVYAYDASLASAQRWRFVARLPTASTLGPCASTGSGQGHPIGPAAVQSPTLQLGLRNCWRGTRDGRHVTFFTDGQLTSDDPDGVSGDIYSYDADRDELTRVSAPQGGVGGTYPCLLIDAGPRCYADDGIGSEVLPRLGVAEDPDGHRVALFESRARLILQDTDDSYDVYQWRDGQLSLISTGTDMDIFYAGSDRAALNVYLATRDRLTWQDRDVVLDIYTARVGGGFDEPSPTDETCDAVEGQCQAQGHQPGSSATDSDGPAAGNPATAGRVQLTLRRPSARQRRRAARTGRLPVTVTVSRAMALTATASARIAGKARRVARVTWQADGAGSTTVLLKLDRAARKRLRTGRALPVSVVVRANGARPVAIRAVLRRR